MRAQIADWKDPDYAPIYRERIARLRKIRADGAAGWARAYVFYKTHPVEYIEDWLFTYDPRKVADGLNPYMPFILFPHQRTYIWWLQDRMEYKEEGIVEKSRDMGISWVSLAFGLWLWTFYPGANVSFGSRKEALVDKLGDADSLFEKIRVMLRKLPPELQPADWDEKKHALFLKIINPENGATITGEGGKNIGRGGRSTIYFVDESAFLEHPDETERALSENSNTRIHVSTPNGMGNKFAEKRHSGRYPVFTFHWTKDPRKDDAWYALRKATLDAETLAAEIDLDYEASGDETVIRALWVRHSQMLRRHYEKLGIDLKGPTGTAGLDVGAGGTGKSVFVPLWGSLFGHSVEWGDDDTMNTAGRADTLAGEHGCRIVFYDSIGVGVGVTAGMRRIKGAKAQGVNVGVSPTRERWPDGKKARDKFFNLKAQLWWTARERLRNAYEHWLFIHGEGGRQHELSEILLLPDDPTLCAQLALPQYGYGENGKIQIESKKHMIKIRRLASPDHAEAAVLNFAPEKRATGSNRAQGLV